MKSFLGALLLGVVVGAVVVSAGATPGNFAYGKVAPFIFTSGFVAGTSFTWFPLELLLRYIRRKQLDHSISQDRIDAALFLSAIPFCLALICAGILAKQHYSERNEIAKITKGELNFSEQMKIVTRYQGHFAKGGGPAHDWEALMRLSRSPSTDSEVLRAIASDGRLGEFEQFLGTNPSTPYDILEVYAKDSNRAHYLRDNPKWKQHVGSVDASFKK